MRSLATISSRAAESGGMSGPLSAYISRTFPLATRGRSARVLTCFDATSATGRDRTSNRPGGGCPIQRRSGDLVQTSEDLAGVLQVVRVVEDVIEVEAARALVGGEQIAQRNPAVPGALGKLLD